MTTPKEKAARAALIAASTYDAAAALLTDNAAYKAFLADTLATRTAEATLLADALLTDNAAYDRASSAYFNAAYDAADADLAAVRATRHAALDAARTADDAYAAALAALLAAGDAYVNAAYAAAYKAFLAAGGIEK